MSYRPAIHLPAYVSVVWRRTTDPDLPPLRAAEAALLHPRATPSRVDEFRTGRAAAHEALAGLGMDGAPLLRGAHREPLWPAGIVGSISHVPGHAIAAVAHRDRCGGLGLDLEHLDRTIPRLGDAIAFEEETEWLRGLQHADRPRAALELFSAKETIYKAFFPRVGRFFGFAAARVVPQAEGGFEGRLVEALDAEYPPERSFPIVAVWEGDLLLTSLVLPP